MVLGDITATNVGTEIINSAAFLALLEALNLGAATAGADTASILVIPHGTNQATIFKLARAAA
jgi:hypothetical protein